MVNRPTFKLPAVVQRPGDAMRKRQSGAPLRRVLGSKRLHYFTASTPSRSPVPQLTPDSRHGSASSAKNKFPVEGITARNLSLDLVRARASVGLRGRWAAAAGSHTHWHTRAATLLVALTRARARPAWLRVCREGWNRR